MFEQLVQTPIQIVLAAERKVRPQQIPQRRRSIPMPVQPPLAARFNESVGRQRRQNQIPMGAFATGEQPLGPKTCPGPATPITTAPTNTPPIDEASRPSNSLSRICMARPPRPGASQSSGKSAAVRIGLRLGVENLNLFDPRRSLGIVDLAQVKHLALDHPAAGATLVLGQAPVAMLLPILEAFMALEEKRRLAHLASQFTRPRTGQKEGSVCHKCF